MRKIIILLISLVFTAASCNLTDPFDITSGSRGVFKSEDGGKSFHPSNNTSQRKDGIGNVSVNVMVFEPGNTDVIYMGSGSGIYKTENGGETWQYILTGIAVADLVVDPVRRDLVYVAGLSGNNGKVIKSTDAGKNWTDVYTEPTKSNAVLSVAISGSVVIAGLGTGEVIRSFDSGNTWQAAKDLGDRIVKIRFGSSSTVYALTKTGGLFKSSDTGGSWTAISSVLNRDNLTSQQNSVSNVSAFHDFALDLRQPGVIYLGTEQGLFRTVNDGAAWNILSLPVKDSALKVSALAVNPTNSNNIFVAIGFTMFKSVNGAITWETRELRTEQAVRLIMVDPATPNVVYLGLGDKK